MRITRKLAVVVTVPLVAVFAFAALTLSTNTQRAMSASRLRLLVVTGVRAGELVHQLQNERAVAAVLLLTRPGPTADARYQTQAAATDTAVQDYRAARARIRSAPAGTVALLDRIDAEIAGLSGVRRTVQTDRSAALSAVTFQYRILIADLLSYRGGVAQAGGATPDLAQRIQAAATLSDASEYLGQQETSVLAALSTGTLTPAAQQQIIAARTGYTDTLVSFAALATPTWQSWLDHALSGEPAVTAQRFQDAVGRIAPGVRPHLDAAQWIAVMAVPTDQLHGVEGRIDASVVAQVSDARDAARWQVAGESLAVLLAVLVAVGVTLRLGRPIIRDLGRLRDAAHDAAYDRLPATVQQLARLETAGGRQPEALAAPLPLPTDRTDEIAEVARAFDTMYREAVRTASEQAAMRASVGAMFVALARRVERLTGALTRELDEAQRDEGDPVRLARLFALDHLVSRMRRNSESLLVLGGEGTARVRDAGEPVSDVLLAAVGRIEHYTRVDLGAVDVDVHVAARVVDHLVQLLTELLDNATAFARPQARVTVEVHRLADRLVVQIADEGLGLDPARRAALNERLGSPPQVDLAAVRSMGLTVVAHIASWYGIRVELRPRPGRGTIAEVTLMPPLYTVVTPDPGVVEDVTVEAGPAQDVAMDARALPSSSGPEWAVGVGADDVPSGAGAGRPDVDSHAFAGEDGTRAAGRPDLVERADRANRADRADRADRAEQADRADRAEPTRRSERQPAAPGAPAPTTASGLPQRRRAASDGASGPDEAAASARISATPGTAVRTGAARPVAVRAGADRRDPERVAGVMAAYARGIGASRDRRTGTSTGDVADGHDTRTNTPLTHATRKEHP